MAEDDTAVCPETHGIDGPSLFQNGDFVFQAHHVGWIIASFFTIVATVTSAWLICKHLMWYTNKREQRYIIRILLLVPVYAIVSLLSYFFWNHSTPIILLRDMYESTVLTAFFYLLLAYLSPDPAIQRVIFLSKGLSKENDRIARVTGDKLKKWVFPLGFIKWKPSDGLSFLQGMKWAILQYCVLRPLSTLAAVVLDYMGLYCEASWGLGWGHVYLTLIVSISVTVAMYCLIQLYVVVSDDLKPYRPLLKLFAIKAVVFLTFWQASFLSLLTMFDVIKDTKYMTAEDINIGIGALLETFEMMLFGFLHIRAFSYHPYRPFHDPKSSDPAPQRTPMLRSFLHAMDFRETFREIWQGWKYMWSKMRGREPKQDQGARRAAHYHSAFGKSRPDGLHSAIQVTKSTIVEKHIDRSKYSIEKEAATLPAVHADIIAEEQTERLWLGIGDDYGYGIQREKSEGLEAQIESELEKRGYGTHIPGRGHIKPAYQAPFSGAAHAQQRSWWRNIYNRISTSGTNDDAEGRVSLPPSNQRKSERNVGSRRTSYDINDERRRLVQQTPGYNDYDIDDPPPPSLIRKSLGRPQRVHNYRQGMNGIQADEYGSHGMQPQIRQMASPPLQTRSPPPEIRQQPPSTTDLHAPSLAPSTENFWNRMFPRSADHTPTSEYAQGRDTPSLHQFGIAGERRTHVQAAVSVGPSISGHIVHVGDEDMHVGTQRSHRRESAFHQGEGNDSPSRPPSPMPHSPVLQHLATPENSPAPVIRSLSPTATARFPPQVSHPPLARDSPPKRSEAIRRNSAQLQYHHQPRSSGPNRRYSAPYPPHAYNPHSPPRQVHSQAAPRPGAYVRPPPPRPPHAPGPPRHVQQEHSPYNRPQGSLEGSPPRLNVGMQYSPDSAGSSMMQPSISGTREQDKYWRTREQDRRLPDLGISTEDVLRYPVGPPLGQDDERAWAQQHQQRAPSPPGQLYSEAHGRMHNETPGQLYSETPGRLFNEPQRPHQRQRDYQGPQPHDDSRPRR